MVIRKGGQEEEKKSLPLARMYLLMGMRGRNAGIFFKRELAIEKKGTGLSIWEGEERLYPRDNHKVEERHHAGGRPTFHPKKELWAPTLTGKKRFPDVGPPKYLCRELEVAKRPLMTRAASTSKGV